MYNMEGGRRGYCGKPTHCFFFDCVRDGVKMTVVSHLPLAETLFASSSVGMIWTWWFELTKSLRTDMNSSLVESW